MSTLHDLNGTYSIDPAHSTIGFVVRHAMITKVRGSFDDLSGTAQINGSDLASSSVRVELKTSSIDTRNEQRDGHLRSGDFFDVEKYPTISFESTAVKAVDDTHLEVTGKLTIKDVTTDITLPLEFTGVAKDAFGAMRAGFEGSTKVNRKDYGLTFNAALETGGVLISDEATLEFEISAIQG